MRLAWTLLACVFLASAAQAAPDPMPTKEPCPRQTGNRVQLVFTPKDASPEMKAKLERLKECLKANGNRKG